MTLDSTSQRCLQNAAALVGVSSLCSPAWEGNGWKNRYFTIPNSVDTSRLQITQSRDQMMAKWGLPANALVAGSYCRIHVDRRPDAVVRALPLLPDPWHAVLIGEQNSQDEMQYLTNLVSQMPVNVQSRVHIMAEDSSSCNVLNAFDVVVSAASGVTESFGLTMAESLYLNKPVVATPYGLAQMHPSYFYNVLLDDTPLNVATAILAAKLGGCKPGAQALVQQTYSPANFISAWTTLLTSLTTKKPAAIPSVLQMATNFGKAVVKHAANGFVNASEEIQAERISTCRACEYYDQPSGRCRHGKCGCWINRKSAWLSERCPIGKW